MTATQLTPSRWQVIVHNSVGGQVFFLSDRNFQELKRMVHKDDLIIKYMR